jgi:hypothetical protein
VYRGGDEGCEQRGARDLSVTANLTALAWMPHVPHHKRIVPRLALGCVPPHSHDSFFKHYSLCAILAGGRQQKVTKVRDRNLAFADFDQPVWLGDVLRDCESMVQYSAPLDQFPGIRQVRVRSQRQRSREYRRTNEEGHSHQLLEKGVQVREVRVGVVVGMPRGEGNLLTGEPVVTMNGTVEPAHGDPSKAVSSVPRENQMPHLGCQVSKNTEARRSSVAYRVQEQSQRHHASVRVFVFLARNHVLVIKHVKMSPNKASTFPRDQGHAPDIDVSTWTVSCGLQK